MFLILISCAISQGDVDYVSACDRSLGQKQPETPDRECEAGEPHSQGSPGRYPLDDLSTEVMSHTWSHEGLEVKFTGQGQETGSARTQTWGRMGQASPIPSL